MTGRKTKPSKEKKEKRWRRDNRGNQKIKTSKTDWVIQKLIKDIAPKTKIARERLSDERKIPYSY